MLASLASLMTLATINLAAFALGRTLLRGLGLEREDRLTRGVWSVALGLITAGLLLAGLGMVGLLYRSLIGVLTLSAAFWGLGILGSRAPRTFVAPSPEPEPAGAPPRWLVRALVALAAVALLASLAAALAPPTAGDAHGYHLELPKRFLADRRITYLPYNDNSTFPLLTEMWFLWAMALEGGVAAQLIHWEMGLLAALATVLLASHVVGRPWAWLAGALVLLVPGFNNQMSAPLNDVALAALCTLAFCAWWRAAVIEEDSRWYIVAGMAAGGALATKYTALLFAAALLPAWLWCMRQPGRRKAMLQGTAALAVVAASVGGIWYVRAAWHRGNPVFPFLVEVFNADQVRQSPVVGTLPKEKAPLAHTPLGWLASPWQATMHPDRLGGRGHQLGPIFLAVLPGLLLSRRLRGLGLVLGVAGAYWTLWYFSRQNVRFLFPVVPLLATAAAWVLAEMRRMPGLPRAVAGAALASALIAAAGLALYRTRDKLPVALGQLTRREWLLRHEPSFAAAEAANRQLEPGSRILSSDYRTFYFDHAIVRENAFRRVNPYDRGLTSPGQLNARLRSQGFSHLLLAETLAGPGIQFDPTLSRLADQQGQADPASLQLLADYHFRDSDGTLRRYRLLALR